MKNILLLLILSISFSNTSFAGEVTGTIDTGVSTDSGLNFQLPCSPASVSYWNVNSKTCAITCDSWYQLSGSSCVAISSWWWGWWWGWSTTIIATCSISYLECKQSISWAYKYYVKSGMNCIWWDLSKTCTPDSMSTKTLSGVVNNLQNSYTWEILQTYIIQFSKDIIQWLDIKKLELYTTFDKDLKLKYQELLDSYESIIETIDLYDKTKDKQYLIQLQELQKKYRISLQEFQDLDGRYTEKVMENNVEILKSIDSGLLIITDKIEKLVTKKLNKRKLLETITQENYDKVIQQYNYFILQINIFKQFKVSSAKEEAKKALKNVISLLK